MIHTRRRLLEAASVLLLILAPAPAADDGQSLEGEAAGRPLSQPPPNVLLILADDLGIDMVAAYGEHPEPGKTPVIDSLAAQGMLFRNAYATSGCTPTRAALLTGKHPFRTQIGFVIDYDKFDFELSVDETSIADALSPLYHTAAVGKWHVATESISGADHPNLLGFDRFAGHMDNFPNEMPEAYFTYDKVVDGVEFESTTYATTDQVDDALALIEEFGSDPWFVWLAFAAPHTPYHKPPAELHTQELPEAISDDYPAHARAMAEAMDTEIGRLLTSLPPDVRANTLVIVIGDNGTAKPATLPPWDPTHAKGTPYEGGINVPLIVAGPGVVQGSECRGLVSIVDILATATDVAGLPAPTDTDSVSMAPYFGQPLRPSLRAWVYSEFFKPNGPQDPYYGYHRVARDERYKVIWRYAQSWTVTTIEFYDVRDDPFETNNLWLAGPLLPDQQAAYDALTLNIEGLIAQMP